MEEKSEAMDENSVLSDFIPPELEGHNENL